MSIVSNYEYIYIYPDMIQLIGDYKQHKGNPSLLRSDSMLKAIGKAINVRVSGILASKIPIVVLGNTPITENYVKKVDFLKTAGVIQGFWSLNPKPTESEFIEKTPNLGFITIKQIEELEFLCKELIQADMNYFSGMLTKNKLGEIITIASKESNETARAEKFLQLIRGE